MRLPNIVKLYALLVFLSGALVGGVAVQFYNARTVRGYNPADMRKQYAEEIRTRLNLNAEQSKRLDAVFEDTHQQFRSLREKYRPEVKAIQEYQAQKIREMLDENQRREYDKMRLERDQKRRQQSRIGINQDGRRLGA
ncbi:MAG TPA: hypothetical protein VN428_10600 [Bryobacteraceae bacterium]|nr:hypothetical protein [Bryobacteraceae bacterium]